MNFARQLAKQYPGDYNIDQICNFYSYCYKIGDMLMIQIMKNIFKKPMKQLKLLEMIIHLLVIVMIL